MKLYILLFLIAIVFYYLYFSTSFSPVEGFDLFGSAPTPPPAMTDTSFTPPTASSIGGEQSIDFWSTSARLPKYYDKVIKQVDENMKGVTGYSSSYTPYYIGNSTEEEKTSFLKNKKWPWDPIIQKFYTDVYMQNKDRAIMASYLPVFAPNMTAYTFLNVTDTKNEMLFSLVADQPNQGPVIRNLYTPDGVSGLFCEKSSYGNIMMTYSGPAKGPKDIPTQIPGFKFLESACDPCDPLFRNPCKWSMNDAVDPFFAKVWNIPPVELK